MNTNNNPKVSLGSLVQDPPVVLGGASGGLQPNGQYSLYNSVVMENNDRMCDNVGDRF